MPTAGMNLLHAAEETSYSIRCALAMLEAIHMTMEQEGNPATCLDALFGLWEYLSDRNEELEASVELAYAELKRPATATGGTTGP